MARGDRVTGARSGGMTAFGVASDPTASGRCHAGTDRGRGAEIFRARRAASAGSRPPESPKTAKRASLRQLAQPGTPRRSGNRRVACRPHRGSYGCDLNQAANKINMLQRKAQARTSNPPVARSSEKTRPPGRRRWSCSRQPMHPAKSSLRQPEAFLPARKE